MGRGFNSARLRRHKRRLRPRVQKPRQQPEVSGPQEDAPCHHPNSGPWSAPPGSFYFSPSCPTAWTMCCLPAHLLPGALPIAGSTISLRPLHAHLCLSASDPLFCQRLQQENHELRRGLAAQGAEWEARAVELEGDVEALRAQLGEQRSEQQDSGRERVRALTELSEQNLRLSQQLAQVGQP